MHRQICRLLPRPYFYLSLSLSPFSLRQLFRDHPLPLLRMSVVAVQHPTPERRDAILVVVVAVVVVIVVDPLSPSRALGVSFALEGEKRGYYRATGWWKSGWSQKEPRPDRGQRTPTRRGSRGCLSVRHRRGWRGSGLRGWLCRLCATRTGKGRKEARPRGTAASATTMASPRISFIGEMSLCARDARRDRITTPRRPSTA